MFYDGWCPLCRSSVSRLEKIDFFHLIQYRSFRDPGIVERYRLDLSKAEQRMLSKRMTDEHYVEGIDSFILIMSRLPLLWPLIALLYLAKGLGVGQAVYDFVAKRRKIVPAGTCTKECAIRK
ncbi:thiol-disulfide oxidoreductase DCC family protein [Mechercharimyces sp. CAU 1602]|uniref:thiol-disulfide oxidoreductase DCC family protein n=1 Tax=Mechercharimyces sp. CAU 1602 TaxID=2973933 RepID=UPI002162410F|nr:DUF393 domain-containing protein [Mechercharimyces sp. CAU 1602]MCS1352297.1 DUF393 domain-containing protein [Mechercharimyces sp. CAU 1602]